jgi:serine/threonine-protein kinase RsbW
MLMVCGRGGIAMDRTELCITNRLEDMAAVVTMVEDFGAAHSIPNTVINDFNVVLDEVLNNIISYGYPDGGTHEIKVRLTFQPGEVLAEVHDEARAFDPLRAAPPDLSGTLQTRGVGGVGIHFVKTLMDDAVYARVGNENQLLLRKRLTTT